MTLTKREEKAQATKIKILHTSIELIEQFGYDEVSISQICKACHVAKGSFYTHFSSKRDIAIELLKGINMKMFSGMKIEQEQPGDAQLMNYVACYFLTVIESGPAISREILKIISSVHFQRKDVASDLHTHFISEYIKLGQQQGLFSNHIDAMKIATYWSDGNLSLVRYWIADPDSYQLTQEGDEFGKFMMEAIRNNI